MEPSQQSQSDINLFNRLVADGQPNLVVLLRSIAEGKEQNLLVASENVISDDPQMIADVRAFLKRHGGQLLIADQDESA